MKRCLNRSIAVFRTGVVLGTLLWMAWMPALAQFKIGGFDSSRGSHASLKDGDFLDDLRASLAAAFPGVQLSASATLTDSFLSDLDVLFISSATGNNTAITPLSAAEQTALLNFVLAGKGAVLLVDNDSFAGSASDPANESVIDPFGLDTTGTGAAWARGATVTTPSASPVTNGFFGTIASYTVGWTGWFNNLGANAVGLATLNDNGQAGLAVIPPGTLGAGSGVVVLFSDSTALVDGFLNANYAALVENAVDYAAGPVGLKLTPASVQGGLKSKGVATLRHPYPTDVFVTFTSSNPAVAKVTKKKKIKKGKMVAKFTVKTKPVASPTEVTITATLNGRSNTTKLTVTP